MRRGAGEFDDFDDDFDDDEPVPDRRSIPWRRLAPGICWFLVAVWVVFAFVRIFGVERTFPLDTFMAFTPYMVSLSLVPLVLALLLRRWRATIVALLTVLALVTVLLGRMVGHPDPGSGPVLRVMGTNMRIGGADPHAIVALVTAHQVDLLAIQEYTPDAARGLLAAGLVAALPFSEQHPIPGAVGSAIFSRYPLSAGGYTPYPGGFGQAYATVSVPGALPVLVESVHPCAPVEEDHVPCGNRGLAREPAATRHGPVRLLIGDFNATLDHVRLRDLIGTGYRDAASELGEGLTPTWPYDGRPFPVVTLDHVLADPRIGIASFRADPVAHTDHRSIFASLTLPTA